jgi:hypothetical protein
MVVIALNQNRSEGIQQQIDTLAKRWGFNGTYYPDCVKCKGKDCMCVNDDNHLFTFVRPLSAYSANFYGIERDIRGYFTFYKATKGQSEFLDYRIYIETTSISKLVERVTGHFEFMERAFD